MLRWSNFTDCNIYERLISYLTHRGRWRICMCIYMRACVQFMACCMMPHLPPEISETASSLVIGSLLHKRLTVGCGYSSVSYFPYFWLNHRWSWGIDDYRKTSNISRTLVGNKIVDHSDAVGASAVGAAPTTSSFSTEHLASRDSAKTAARQYETLLSVDIWCDLY